MNSSDALRARRDAERAERRRNERLQERADEQAEREREEARAEQRRQEAAREEAAVRAAEDQARERRQARLVQLRKSRLAAVRGTRALAERRLLAAAARRTEERETAARAERLQGQVAERRATERERTAAAKTRRELSAERQERAREEERQAGARAAAAEQIASERRAEESEAARLEGQLEEQRRRLAEQRRLLEERSAAAERRRAEAAAQAREARLRELLAGERRAAVQGQARAARLQEQKEQRAAEEAAAARSAELRASEAARRERERRALAAQEERERARRAAAGSARRSELDAGLERTELAWLRTEGRDIVAWGGERQLLRGVAVRGLDDALAGTRPLAEALALDGARLELLTDSWGVNLVRLPFSAESIPGADLTELDDLVGTLAASGVYTLLALEPPEVDGETPLPDEATMLAWKLLANRYQSEPGALFEVYAAAAPLAEGWPRAALELIHAIRSRHQSSLLLLPEHGGELGPVANLVYAARLAPGARVRLDERFAAFAARLPVLVTDWREDGTDPAGPATVTAGLLERHELGWCAGNWNTHPRLVVDADAGRLTETRFGLAVRRALAAPAPPALTPF